MTFVHSHECTDAAGCGCEAAARQALNLPPTGELHESFKSVVNDYWWVTDYDYWSGTYDPKAPEFIDRPEQYGAGTVLFFGDPIPLPTTTATLSTAPSTAASTATAATSERTTMAVDSPEAIQLTADAVDAGVASESKRHQLLLLGRHHGIDALRDAVGLLARSTLTKDQLSIIQTCGLTVEQYIAGKARKKRGA